MGIDLLNFLDLVPEENLVHCGVELKLEHFQALHAPAIETREFQTVESLYQYVDFALENDYSLLSVYFDYPGGKSISMDILMGKLSLKNSVNLVSLDQLNEHNLVGSQRFIEEIRMEFT